MVHCHALLSLFRGFRPTQLMYVHYSPEFRYPRSKAHRHTQDVASASAAEEPSGAQADKNEDDNVEIELIISPPVVSTRRKPAPLLPPPTTQVRHVDILFSSLVIPQLCVVCLLLTKRRSLKQRAKGSKWQTRGRRKRPPAT